MIISHAHKFIFIKTAKVGGTSLEIALSKFCGPDDVITPITPEDEALRRSLGFRGAQNYRPRSPLTRLRAALDPRYARRHGEFFNHFQAKDLKRRLPEEVWRSYLKFSIVRNPFDRVVSTYYWHTRKDAKKAQFPDLETFVLSSPEVILSNRRKLSVDGAQATDVMIRYEHLAEDLGTLSDRLGLPENIHDVMSQIQTKANLRPPRSLDVEYRNAPRAIQLISLLAAPEIETYGYHAPKIDG